MVGCHEVLGKQDNPSPVRGEQPLLSRMHRGHARTYTQRCSIFQSREVGNPDFCTVFRRENESVKRRVGQDPVGQPELARLNVASGLPVCDLCLRLLILRCSLSLLVSIMVLKTVSKVLSRSLTLYFKRGK